MPRHRAAVLLLLLSAPAAGADDGGDFFERKVRPLLAEQCLKCHGEGKGEPKGGLRVDSRAALLAGGDTGPAVVPGKPNEGKLLEAVRYGNADLLMPPKGKLPPDAIAVLEEWVRRGAPWPGGDAPAATAKAFDLEGRKASHWSWKPVAPQSPPAVKNAAWPRDPADAFVLAKLEAAGLSPAAAAPQEVWLRRAAFAITGLPPTPEEVESFLQSAIRNPQSAMEAAADRLLASPHYGERWGRHWLDLARYAESRGHEFDYEIPQAWRYRDAVVRALNADVPYRQFVREQLAGDLLPEPRFHPTDGSNESVQATAFWLLGEELHSPVDVRQDQSDRVDNRLDVFGKTFLGLTIACARCHDHKFDALSAKDYAALYGVVEGSGYRQVRIDGWRENRAVARELAALREATHAALGGGPAEVPAPSQAFAEWLAAGKVVADYANLKPGEFLPDDVTFGPEPRPAGFRTVRDGQLRIEPLAAAVFDRFWAGLTVAPGQSPDPGELGKRQRAGFTIRTPSATAERGAVYALVRGGGLSYAAVCGHCVIAGPLHGGLVHALPDSAGFRWVKHDLSGYQGQPFHLELTADPGTDFAVAMVVQADAAPPAEPFSSPLSTLERGAGGVRLLSEGNLTPQPPLQSGEGGQEKALARRVVWQSRTAPALWEGTGWDERVFVRGNPRSPGDAVPRRNLEALAGTAPLPHGGTTGRLQLADQLTDPARNPYLGRVAVNRAWHHLFGRGLVGTPDNFGALGEAPSHPELLDALADDFLRDGGSLKRLIRRLVLSSTYRQSSDHRPEAAEKDPSNLLLHTFRRKRLEGEAIRDSLLTLSGRLDPRLGGAPVPAHLTAFQDGRGRPRESGPLDGAGRRSVYLAVRRNFLNPFLLAFDTPSPFSSVGRRQVSNVPAQALVMLNDPFVHEQAARAGARFAALPRPADERLGRLWLAAFARPATGRELAECRAFLAGRGDDPVAWGELAHALANVKEFVFLR